MPVAHCWAARSKSCTTTTSQTRTPAPGSMRRLISDDKVDLLIGPYSSDVTLVASNVAKAHGFPMVSPSASAEDIWSRGYRNIFQVDTPADRYMDLLIESASDAGLTTIALALLRQRLSPWGGARRPHQGRCNGHEARLR